MIATERKGERYDLFIKKEGEEDLYYLWIITLQYSVK